MLRHGRRETVRLEEVDPAIRGPILRRYLDLAPGARPHVPVDRRAPVEQFDRIAADYPVFRITTDRPDPRDSPRTPSKRAPLTFFALAFAPASPFWILGTFVRAPKGIPMDLPWSVRDRNAASPVPR